MALSVSDVRAMAIEVCARPDVLDACRRGELDTVIAVFGAHGVTQGQLSALTGISQGRLSEYMTGKRRPRASTTFQAFADGVGMPPAAREALGVAPDQPGPAIMGRQPPGQPVPRVGLAYPDTPLEGAENLTWLWRSDLSDATPRWGRADPMTSSDASLRWLVDPGRKGDSDLTGGVRIGLADVETLPRDRRRVRAA